MLLGFLLGGRWRSGRDGGSYLPRLPHLRVDRDPHHLSLWRLSRPGRLGNLDNNGCHHGHAHIGAREYICSSWRGGGGASSSRLLLLHHHLLGKLLRLHELLHHGRVHCLGHHRSACGLREARRHEAWRHAGDHRLSWLLLCRLRRLMRLFLLFFRLRLFRRCMPMRFRLLLLFIDIEFLDSVDQLFLFDLLAGIRSLSEQLVALIFVVVT